MNKEFKYLVFSIFVSLIFLLSAYSAKAVDVCATENLNTQQQAEDNCPSAAVCGKDNWSGSWSPFKAGMGCHSNYSESVCGCKQTPCCGLCTSEYAACRLACGQLPERDPDCYTICANNFVDCGDRCEGGCTSSKEAIKDEEEKELKQKKSSSSKESLKEKEPAKEKETAVEKEPSNREEPPKAKESPSREEHSSKS